MYGDDSGPFFEQLAALARHVPAEEESRAALEAAHRAIELSRDAKQRKRRFWMRITIPSSIAAALVAAAVFTTLMPGTQKASAADQLDQAVQATQAYRGWTHWTQTNDVVIKAPDGSPAPKRRTCHYNSEAHVFASVTEFEDHTDFQMVWLPEHKAAEYSTQSRLLVIKTLTQVELVGMEKGLAPPVTVEAFKTAIKEAVGHDPTVKEVQDGNDARFDMQMFADQAEADAFRAAHHAPAIAGNGLSVWVNKDHLVTRVRMNVAIEGKNLPMDTAVTYGLPEFKDIYDLGVPRDAKVMDSRVGEFSKQSIGTDLPKFESRLEERRQKGFGDSVALLSSAFMDSTGQHIEKNAGNVALYINQGDKWLANQYVLFLPARDGRDHPVLKESPAEWPALDAAKLLPTLKNALPQSYWIMNGDHGWRGSLDNKSGTLSVKPATREKDGPLFTLQTLPQRLWPRDAIIGGLGIDPIQAKLLEGNILRTRANGLTTTRAGGTGVFETTYLFDLSKDDLPTESDRNTVDKETNVLVDRFSTHCTAFAKLPNGQWYPTDWTETSVQRDPATGIDNGSIEAYHLQIIPGMKVDGSWFAEPRGTAGMP